MLLVTSARLLITPAPMLSPLVMVRARSSALSVLFDESCAGLAVTALII